MLLKLTLPDTCEVQVVPPLPVASMAPALPTARHTWLLAQLMELSVWLVPEVCATQVVPPLVVARIFPVLPTAMH
jgi:hypothetical protein